MRRLITLALLALAGSAWALPDQIDQQGYLADAEGRSIEGPVNIEIRLYAGAVGGPALFTELHPRVELFDGIYNVRIGAVEQLDPALFRQPSIYAGFSVDGGAELSPRIPLTKVPAAMAANVADNVVGHITPKSVTIPGVGQIIDAGGRWVGDPTGLRGPEGPAGAAGPRGEIGPAGPAGGNADPAAVVPLVVAAVVANPGALPFLRDDVDDVKQGDLGLAGGDLVLDTGRVTLSRGRLELGAGGVRTGIAMANHDLVAVNSISFNDPGPDGSIRWGGSQARIFVSTPGGANTDGALRLVNDDGIRLESAVVATGDVEVEGRLGVGTDNPEGRAEIRDDSAQETGLTVRNWRAGTNTRPFLQLLGLTTGNQGARALLRLVTGGDAGGNDASNDGGLQVVVSSGGAGALRTAMTVQHDGDVGVGTTAPLGKLHVSGADSRRNPVVISSSSPGLYLHDTETSNGNLRYASFAIEADGSKLFMGSRPAAQASTMGVGSRQFTLTEAGNVGVGDTAPSQKLVVRGDTLIDGDLTVTGAIKHSGPSAEARPVGRVSANALQAREREIVNFTLNDHHWSTSNGFFVEAYSRYYDSGYVRFYVELGYRSKSIRKIEARGDLATRFGLRMEEDAVVGQRGGHPERRYRVYAQADYYSQWEVFVRTASMRYADGDVSSDGLLGLQPGSGHQNVAALTNNARLNSMEGDLEVTGEVRHKGVHRAAARAVCYSALVGNNNHSIIMVPLPNNGANLDSVCHSSINNGWHAGGVAKANYYHQNCSDLDNTSYGGGYTSYVTEAYFEGNRGNYPDCGPSNAFICCSPQFPN